MRRFIALSVLLAASIASCGVPLEDRTRTIPNEDVLFELLEPATTTTTSTTSTTVVDPGPTTTTVPLQPLYLYLVRTNRIEKVRRDVTEPLGYQNHVLVLSQPLSGEETSRGFRSAVPSGAVTDVQVSGGVATVDLTPLFTEVGPTDQVLAFAQITWTLLQLPGIGQVAFTKQGQPIQPLDADGTVVPAPGLVTKETYEALLAS